MRMKAGTKTRKATNITLDIALVEEAKELGVNISVAAAEGLKQAVAKTRAARWLEENRAALDASNAWIEANGLPLEKHRLF